MCIRDRLIVEVDAQKGADHVGAGLEGLGRYLFQYPRLTEIAHQRGEVAPLLVAGEARHALGGLLLHHHGDAFIARPAQKQALYDVGGDVVGQVGHHARAGGGEGGKVGLQRVGVEDAGVFAALEHGGKHRLQSPVQFHGGDGAGPTREQAGHQAGAGADFQHIVRRRDAGKVDEVGKQVFIQQKEMCIRDSI